MKDTKDSNKADQGGPADRVPLNDRAAQIAEVAIPAHPHLRGACAAAVRVMLREIERQVLEEIAFADKRSEEYHRKERTYEQAYFSGYGSGLGYARRMIIDALASGDPKGTAPTGAPESSSEAVQSPEILNR